MWESGDRCLSTGDNKVSFGIRVKFWDHVKVGGCTLRGNEDVRSGGDIGG